MNKKSLVIVHVFQISHQYTNLFSMKTKTIPFLHLYKNMGIWYLRGIVWVFHLDILRIDTLRSFPVSKLIKQTLRHFKHILILQLHNHFHWSRFHWLLKFNFAFVCILLFWQFLFSHLCLLNLWELVIRLAWRAFQFCYVQVCMSCLGSVPCRARFIATREYRF